MYLQQNAEHEAIDLIMEVFFFNVFYSPSNFQLVINETQESYESPFRIMKLHM